ncbi:MAG: acetyltransferase [Zymomonas mobilis]|uniref:acetyltransferase n=1 Tax=Zymomonas mobilis TaxID=542 RepID=UPI0001B7052C|nr:acetyltransferase [Zymomonas mobilis]ACV75089.1 GCN5-related N-acetyltransferase [Zymomonas mobilis subsp. mobilis NCIMB 11163]ART93042.1 acetyltransferase [Zymomonas mobilis subsp. mobilis]TWD59716.1 putative acetyltransferase [Zymomonas mobilis]
MPQTPFISRIRQSNSGDGQRVMEIWRDAVQETHLFLKAKDRFEIEKSLSDFLPMVSLWLAVDDSDNAIGFMLCSHNHLEALFIDPHFMGQGIGRRLVQQAISFCNDILSVDVNEENSQALGFYRHLGFIETGRSKTDRQGYPYPLIFMHLPRNILK